MRYYFFGATLPTLHMERAPAMSLEEFNERAAEQLSPADATGLRDILDDAQAESGHGFAAEWKRSECCLRNAITRQRASQLKKDPRQYVRGEDGAGSEAERAALGAFSKSDPVERERDLDRFRWRVAEDLGGVEPFTSRAILAYAVKLRIAERWSSLAREAGAKKIDDCVEENAVLSFEGSVLD